MSINYRINMAKNTWASGYSTNCSFSFRQDRSSFSLKYVEGNSYDHPLTLCTYKAWETLNRFSSLWIHWIVNLKCSKYQERVPHKIRTYRHILSSRLVCTHCTLYCHTKIYCRTIKIKCSIFLSNILKLHHFRSCKIRVHYKTVAVSNYIGKYTLRFAIEGNVSTGGKKANWLGNTRVLVQQHWDNKFPDELPEKFNTDAVHRPSIIRCQIVSYFRVPKYDLRKEFRRATWSSHLYLSGTNIENVSLQSIELRWHKV